MRDRLSQLIFNKLSETCGECSSLECTEKLTDYLLANGVIVPPCKVGDYVEWDTGLQLRLYRVNGFIYDTNDSVWPLRYDLDDIQPIITHCAIKRILSEEEAEAALVNYESSTIEKGGAEK